MNSNDQNLTGISSSQIGRTPETETGDRHGGTDGAGEDPVQLADLAGYLRSLSPETPERAAYLEKLSAEVQSGRYSLDAHELSREIVDDALGNSALKVLKKGAGAG